MFNNTKLLKVPLLPAVLVDDLTPTTYSPFVMVVVHGKDTILFARYIESFVALQTKEVLILLLYKLDNVEAFRVKNAISNVKLKLPEELALCVKNMG